MDASDVTALVAVELRNAHELTGAHGFTPDTVRRHLVVPPRQEQVADGPGGRTLSQWVVLEEDGSGGEGYVVLLDDARRTFGLAYRAADSRLGFVGYYGSLVDTLNGM